VKITKQEKLDIFRKMLLVRAFEEKAGELFQQNLIPGFIHLSIGEEASSVGTCSVLRKETTWQALIEAMATSLAKC